MMTNRGTKKEGGTDWSASFQQPLEFQAEYWKNQNKGAELLFFSPACSLLSFTAQQVPYFEREKATKTSTHFSSWLINLFAFPVYISFLQGSPS